MNYTIKRDLQEYGPYTLAELQRYVASGNVLLTDLCKSEGMADWVAVSQVIGTIPVPQVAAAPASAAPYVSPFPPPPSLHWGIALLLFFVTCTLFGWVWMFVQAAWVKKVQPNSKAVFYYSGALGVIVLMFFYGVVMGATGHASLVKGDFAIVTILGRLGILTLMILGNFDLKNSIEEHYNSAEPIGLSLNGVIIVILTIFSAGYVYFQYHFTEIIEMKNRQASGMGTPR